ncbi:hypothetical protein Tco_0502074 [Tanacetum coccineum]
MKCRLCFEPAESYMFPIKALYFSELLGSFHVEDCLNLLGVFPDPHGVDDVSQEFTLFDFECAFSWVDANLSSELLVYRCLIGCDVIRNQVLDDILKRN